MAEINRDTPFAALSFNDPATDLGVFPTAACQHQARDAGDDPAKEHPDGLVSRRSSKEPGRIGGERVHGVDPKNHEHDAKHQQSDGNDSIHNDLSVRF
jgi:hypothetical protein